MNLKILFLLSLLLSCGCVGNVQKEQIVCDEPYMRFAAGCCLDANDNRICDTDETTTSTSTTSTSTSTTTTTSQATTTTKATTTSTTTSTSTTQATLKLPVTEKDFEAHVKASEEYRNLQRTYDQKDIGMGVGSHSYEDTIDILADVIARKHFTGCLNCFNFSGGRVWVAEFGAVNIPNAGSYACLIDRETGTGTMYHLTDNDATCRCDTI